MPARKSRSPDEKPQFERFIETARQIGAGETDEALERALDKIAPPKRTKAIQEGRGKLAPEST